VTPDTEDAAGAAASKGVPRDPEGTFTRGTPEACASPPLTASVTETLGKRPEERVEAGEERPVRRGVRGNESPLKTVCHVETVSSLRRAALHVLPSEAVHQPVTSWINQEAKVSQKVHPEDGELDSS
jgi:hypothetical protein